MGGIGKSMSKKSELIYWDASVLIKLIKGNEEPQSDMDSVLSVVECVTNGTYRIAVSTLIYPEVLASTMSDDACSKFEGFMQKKRASGNSRR